MNVQETILTKLRENDYNRMADHVAEQFEKGMSFNDVWTALQEINELFRDVSWLEWSKK